MKALKTLTFGIYNFNKLPEHMNMGKYFNYAKTFDSTTKLFEFNAEERNFPIFGAEYRNIPTSAPINYSLC